MQNVPVTTDKDGQTWCNFFDFLASFLYTYTFIY